MAKDFFDEEYDKKTQQEADQKQVIDSWYSRPAPVDTAKKGTKPLYIVLLCVALVLCIAFGWVLGYVFQGIGHNSVADEGADILSTVIDYLQNNYYKDINDETWIKAIELSGTALMQYAGDRFSQLMSPQTYYNFMNPTASSASANDSGYFGVSFFVEEGIGLYVSSVTANSNAYGKLYAGDIVLQLTDMKGVDDKTPTVDGVEFSKINLGEWASTTIEAVLDETVSATFHVLRWNDSSNSYSIEQISLKRGPIYAVSSRYNYQFIEFYFDDEHRNISKPSDNIGVMSTYEERGIASLSSLEKTGYVRIDQFMDYVKVDDNGNVITDKYGDAETVSAADEFKKVMDLFSELGLKHLVLDLKGNPGGNVQYVSDIAGMLVTDAKLTAAQKSKVAGTGKNAGKLLITYLEMPKPAKVRQNQFVKSSYYSYFGSIGDKCDIVVWTDGNSASASELLTGTLRDYGTAVQMGTTTYGKGIAQTWEELPFTGKVKDLSGKTIDYHWAIYYTCASYFSPFGKNIHGVGYTPEGSYNNLRSYTQLWNATIGYWN